MEEITFDNIKRYYQQLAPGLSDEAWADFSQCLKIREVQKGERIDEPGKVSNSVFWVEKGLLYDYQIIDGKESISAFFPDQTYGSVYDSFLTRTPSNYYVDAVEDSVLILLGYEDMQAYYAKYPALERFGRKIAEYLFVFLSNRVHSLQNESAEKRYRDFVIEWPKRKQRRGGRGMTPQDHLVFMAAAAEGTMQARREKK